MPIIINEIEVIAPPPSRAESRNTESVNLSPAGPTPRDIYWVTRKLMERQLRSQSR
ncbi:hypothetical protein JOY44_01975 [Phormidium sp. CLA17]|uniref:hypothetical protein n=1 Tax=Leptolyngbya sp. Cla-17 TaxID=2803751 RepID=UPI001932F4E0|nr:hypothetical protein [Leptolyngbya sp. Cla-17]MBM0740395.1 hypothetical protein [Leptolyngbya sp. Cla-17]